MTMEFDNPKTVADLKELQTWVFDQLKLIEKEFNFQRDAYYLKPLTAAPRKPRDGMVVYADGTTWNPGGGRGIYAYIDDGTPAWTKLG